MTPQQAHAVVQALLSQWPFPEPTETWLTITTQALIGSDLTVEEALHGVVKLAQSWQGFGRPIVADIRREAGLLMTERDRSSAIAAIVSECVSAVGRVGALNASQSLTGPARDVMLAVGRGSDIRGMTEVELRRSLRFACEAMMNQAPEPQCEPNYGVIDAQVIE